MKSLLICQPSFACVVCGQHILQIDDTRFEYICSTDCRKEFDNLCEVVFQERKVNYENGDEQPDNVRDEFSTYSVHS